MFIPFLYELRRRKVPVGTQEAVALAAALRAGLHGSSLDGFYHVARALLVHSEAHLDAYDQAFALHFQGAAAAGVDLHQQLLDWLREAKARRQLSDEERALLEQFDLEELHSLFEQRLREQTERHDGGNNWIGTGGTSPFGHSGAAREGFRVGGPGGNRSAIRIAEQRGFQAYRSDILLDTRQMAVALRRLRAFAREGHAEELDVDGTIDATAKNAGELEVVTRPPRRPNTRVVLMMDVGGSMDPHAQLVGRLFSAASKASHFKELRTYYFHNCIYGRVFKDARFSEPVSIPDLLAEVGRHYKLVMVGDALMAPYELEDRGGPLGHWDPDALPGLAWMMKLTEHFQRSAWLNPEAPRFWKQPTIDVLRHVFDMFPLTLEGLTDAVAHLTRGAKGAR